MIEKREMKVYAVDNVWQVEETQEGSTFLYYARWANAIDIKVCIGVSQDVALTEAQVVDLMRSSEIGVFALMKQHENILAKIRGNS